MNVGTITTGLAGEGGHWYCPDGSPAYEIIGANGKQRPVTLRDARKHHLYPGVSSVIRCAAAPALEAWKRQQVLLAACTLPRVEGETPDAFAARALADSEAQSLAARARGIEIHTEIETALKGGTVSGFAGPVLDWLMGTFGRIEWNPERSFCSASLGYGGKIDLSSLASSPEILIDYKSKDFTRETLQKVKVYDEQLMQLVAYQHGLGFPPETRLINLFVSTQEPGLIVAHEWSDPAQRERGWAMFQALLAYWKAQKRL